VTSFGDDVFVARYQSPHLDVYDAQTLALRRYLTVPGLSSCPTGLATCRNNCCLYASDYYNHSVHRVELSGSGAAKTWPLNSCPTGLSVNSAHNVIVACCDDDKLQEYTAHGSLLREICLRGGMTRPWNAIHLSTGDYAVSHCTSPGVVSVVGVDGRVVCSYGQSQTSDVVQMKYPTSLVVTKNDDILVADEKNNRILSVNSALGSIQELYLSVDGGIQRPRGLYLNESRGRLYVGEFATEYRLLVFDGVRM